MATLDDVRAIALALPGVVERLDGQRGGVSWRTPSGGFVWERGPSGHDLQQLDALGREWPDAVVVGVRTDGEQAKLALIETYPDAFFTIPHFDGYPAVLVRLDTIDRDLLREVVTDAWLLKVTKRVADAWLAEHPPA
ncbi:MmcQ/YjbR family DNA-binding protein [Microbacterium sp. NPDC058389]|uniref:MmcQ/YjbR family DNA-binding protein n=1 Tax=Microbacterium sp. NPDC058389 TaxID=3346475 RepID=UPI00364B461C